MDPPYGSELGSMVLERVAHPAWLAEGGWISIETADEALDLPLGLALEAERRFGKARLGLLSRA